LTGLQAVISPLLPRLRGSNWRCNPRVWKCQCHPDVLNSTLDRMFTVK